MSIYATAITDERTWGSVRADNRDVFIEDFLTLLHVEVCRRRYRDERANPEWVDVGGEA